MSLFEFLSQQQAITRINALGTKKQPFLFIIDFEQTKSIIIPVQDIDPELILFQTPLSNNLKTLSDTVRNINITPHPLSQSDYAAKFDRIIDEIHKGNSFVANLTVSTPIDCNATTHDILYASEAKYKLWIKDMFVCFSPETFIKTRGNKIYTHPMKGTIDASLPDAAEKILNNRKEAAEHNCIVDLLRNDISQVAEQVKVSRYRYIDRIQTHKGALLQVSSEITGVLPENYQMQLGDILFSLLPAGSITGAPKIKTTGILKHTEQYERGYYTGIFGIFDGQDLDSAVMIRFIEETSAGLVYKSGGGITAKSDMEEEYNEMIAKIYVPVTRNN